MLKIIKKIKNQQGGFIALISTTILVTILLMIMTTTNISSFFARFNTESSQFKRISLGLSESCLNIALLRIAQNYNYDGNEIININSDECYIYQIIYSDPDIDLTSGLEKSKTATIKTKARYPNNIGSWSINEIKAKIQNPAYRDPINPLFVQPIKIESWVEIIS